MADSSYSIPAQLHDLLHQHAVGDADAALKNIVTAFMARNDAPMAVAFYIPVARQVTRAQMSSAVSTDDFWEKVDQLASQVCRHRDYVIAAALHAHFSQQGIALSPRAAFNAAVVLHVPIEKNLYARLRQEALRSRVSQHDLVTTAIKRYLADPTQFEPLLSYKKGTKVTMFHYDTRPELLERIAAAMPAHQTGKYKAEPAELVSLAITVGFRRAEIKAAAARRSRLRTDHRFKL